MAAAVWDLLIQNALVFDGTGNPPEVHDIAVKNGKIAAKGKQLPAKQAKKALDAQGLWLMPGLIDIHTHFDLEVEADPRLPESVRHGTTSMVMSNCSLGIAFGRQMSGERPYENPILDCFARVENIPKNVLAKCVDAITWDNTGDYIKHFDDIPLGPNVAPMLPHSMLRIEVMGLEDSISREPTDAELKKMEQLVRQAMEQGYVGFSTDGLPLHFLANDPHRNKKIPTQYATYKELKTLTHIVREYDRVWQATPDPDNPAKTVKMFSLTSGKLHGKTLKVTATAAIDLHTNKRGAQGMLKLSKLLNSKFMKGFFRFQTLSAPFRLYADGVTTPLMEEKPSFRELNALEVEDREGRKALLDSAAFMERFKADWHTGKKGYNVARLQRWLAMEPTTFSRNLSDMTMDSVSPEPGWENENLEAIYQRLLQFQSSNGSQGAKDSNEKIAFEKCPNPIGDDAEFVMHLLREYDKDFRWHATTANSRPEVLKGLLFHDETLPGFNDSGAHLTNMAFYDGNLRTLKIAINDSIELVATAVKKLTRDPANLFGLDAGTLDFDAQADIVLIDPAALKHYDSEANTTMIYRDIFQHNQMVNRSDGVVKKVFVAGKEAWNGTDFNAEFGKTRYGKVLTYTPRATGPNSFEAIAYEHQQTDKNKSQASTTTA